MTRPVWVVCRRAWEHRADGAFEPVEDDRPGVFARVPVRAFADPAAAEACRAELERQARQVVAPGRVDRWPGWDDWDAGDRVGANLAAAGLDPVGPDPAADLRAWWELVGPGLTPAQRDAAWAAVGPAVFFEVVETTLED